MADSITRSYTLVRKLARLAHEYAIAYKNNDGREQDLAAEANWISKNLLPSGSGFNNGTQFLIEKSSATRLVFLTAFSHTDEHGGHSGWTSHRVIVTASLMHPDYTMKVTGRDKNGVKDYIYNVFDECLTQQRKEAVPATVG